MKWNILHESRGRIRLHLRKSRMSLAEADQLQDYLTSLPGVRTAAVYERTCDVVIVYTESRAGIVRGLAAFRFDTEALAEVPANSPRAVNREYQEKLVNMTIFHLARKLFLPMPLRIAYTAVRSLPYLWRGLTCPIFSAVCGAFSAASSRSRSSTRCPSACRCCAAISARQAPSCSCCAWASCWRNGPARNRWATWPAACR